MSVSHFHLFLSFFLLCCVCAFRLFLLPPPPPPPPPLPPPPPPPPSTHPDVQNGKEEERGQEIQSKNLSNKQTNKKLSPHPPTHPLYSSAFPSTHPSTYPRAHTAPPAPCTARRPANPRAHLFPVPLTLSLQPGPIPSSSRAAPWPPLLSFTLFLPTQFSRTPPKVGAFNSA